LILSDRKEGNQKIEIEDDDDVDEVSFSLVMSVHDWILGLDWINSFARVEESTQIEL
jgi:hypothetical protein